jgi:hypothetical protein
MATRHTPTWLQGIHYKQQAIGLSRRKNSVYRRKNSDFSRTQNLDKPIPVYYIEPKLRNSLLPFS